MPKKIVQTRSKVEEMRAEQSIKEWQQAMINLHKNYTELTGYVNQLERAQKQPLAANLSLGQCPRAQLVRLIHQMQSELKRLIQDMALVNRTGRAVSAQTLTQRLATHTLAINRLNAQAQTRLHLLASSAS